MRIQRRVGIRRAHFISEFKKAGNLSSDKVEKALDIMVRASYGKKIAQSFKKKGVLIVHKKSGLTRHVSMRGKR